MSYYWREITDDAHIAVRSWRPEMLMEGFGIQAP